MKTHLKFFLAGLVCFCLVAGVAPTGNYAPLNSPVFTGHPTIEGVTSTGATGTGKQVYDTSPAFTTGIGLGRTPRWPLDIKTATDENLELRSHTNLASGILTTAINDAESANAPWEFRATYFAFTTGGINLGGTGNPGSGNLQVGGSVIIGGGTAILKVLSATATLDFGSTAAGTNSDLTITVTGAALGDVVSVGIPNGSIVAGGIFYAWVSATDTVKVRFENGNLVSASDPASGTFRVMVTQF